MAKQIQKLISWNVNGLRAVVKKDNFWQDFRDLGADVFGIQETKLQADQIPPEILESDLYSCQYHAHAVKKGYSGVSVFSRREPDKIIRDFPGKKVPTEGRWLELHFPEFVFFNIYFPNGSQSQERLEYKMEFYHYALKYFQKLRRGGKHLVIGGDYNTAHQPIDLKHPKANEKNSGFLPIERAWMDELVAAGFVDTFRHFHPGEPDHYSWWTYRGGARARNVGWRIDYFFVNREALPAIESARIHPEIMGSDHCPVSLELDLGKL